MDKVIADTNGIELRGIKFKFWNFRVWNLNTPNFRGVVYNFALKNHYVHLKPLFGSYKKKMENLLR